MPQFKLSYKDINLVGPLLLVSDNVHRNSYRAMFIKCLLPVKVSLIYALGWRNIFITCKSLTPFFFIVQQNGFVEVISHEGAMQEPSMMPEMSHYKFSVLCIGHFSIFKRQFQGKVQTGIHF